MSGLNLNILQNFSCHLNTHFPLLQVFSLLILQKINKQSSVILAIYKEYLYFGIIFTPRKIPHILFGLVAGICNFNKGFGLVLVIGQINPVSGFITVMGYVNPLGMGEVG